MRKKFQSIRSLAAECGRDPDDVLILLWDNEEFEHIKGCTDKLSPRQYKNALHLLGLPTPKEIKSLAYWRSHLSLSKASFDAVLNNLRIRPSQNAKRLPKRAISILRKYAKEQNTLPIRKPTTVAAPPKSPREVPWEEVGHKRDLWMPQDKDIEAIYYALVKDFDASADPIRPMGFRNGSKNLLSSALSRPSTGYGGELKYPTVEMAGAALLHSIVHNHPFLNGNKRTALVALLVFLDKNGLMLTCGAELLFKHVLLVAQHKIVQDNIVNEDDAEVIAIARWIVQHSRLIKQGDHPLQWRRLKQILRHFECEFNMADGGGGRINISRTHKEPRRLLGAKIGMRKVPLRTQVYYPGDGREAAVNTIAKIRNDLRLDDNHGFDSRVFYEKGPPLADDFIMKYRKILQRLARL